MGTTERHQKQPTREWRSAGFARLSGATFNSTILCVWSPPPPHHHHFPHLQNFQHVSPYWLTTRALTFSLEWMNPSALLDSILLPQRPAVVSVVAIAAWYFGRENPNLPTFWWHCQPGQVGPYHRQIHVAEASAMFVYALYRGADLVTTVKWTFTQLLIGFPPTSASKRSTTKHAKCNHTATFEV
ncbi:uncharacterized protein UTRI_02281 [Ustilago trichophora]|uniref:Uncharacterized protein n=1 Tax=Ustilago trichophora TaxID=86804 RepID=A0A5C3E8Q8_9BASI|nr:uncharacterized protein UTRI_02281 [Ustilago trichophora]